MKILGVLQLGLQLDFKVTIVTCKSYFYNVNAIELVVTIALDTP
jgi:hypothetical protein